MPQSHPSPTPLSSVTEVDVCKLRLALLEARRVIHWLMQQDAAQLRPLIKAIERTPGNLNNALQKTIHRLKNLRAELAGLDPTIHSTPLTAANGASASRLTPNKSAQAAILELFIALLESRLVIEKLLGLEEGRLPELLSAADITLDEFDQVLGASVADFGPLQGRLQSLIATPRKPRPNFSVPGPAAGLSVPRGGLHF